MIGQTVGRYRILEKLGEGGMGSVWRAEESVLQRQVALKLLPQALAGDQLARQRFLREARSASYLDHPGIATVYDAGEADGQVYIAFQLVEGETVHDRLRRGPMDVGEALRVATAAAEALQYAHQGGTSRRPVIHRDISGRNIMLAADGRVIIVDFGLARPEGQTRLTLTGTAMGTAGYMSPEVIQGKEADRRSDVYGLGVVLYQMLTGRLPFVSENLQAMLYATVHKPPDPPSRFRPEVPPDLGRVVLRALAKDPGTRYQWASDLATDLQSVQRGEPVLQQPSALSQAPTMVLSDPAQVPATSSWGGRSSRLAVILTVVAVLAVGSITAYRWASSGAQAGASRSDRIAVLPFENASRDQHDAYLASGMSRDLVDALGRLDLNVTPWITAQRYAGDDRPVQALAEELGVSRLVTGSVRMVGVMLQGNIGLIDGKTGMQSWAYEHTDSEYLVVLRGLAEALAARLRPGMDQEQIRAALQFGAPDPEAYDLYLKGAHAMQTLASGQDPTRRLDLRLFQKALQADPDLAVAHVAIGAIHSQIYYAGSGGLDDLRLAEEHFASALDLNPGLADARTGLIRLLWYQGRSEGILRQGQLVAELPRQQVPELLARAQAYLLSGLGDRGVPLLERALELDPANEAARWFLCLTLVWSGRHEDAIQAGQQYVERFGPDSEIHTWVGFAHDRLGESEAARKSYEQAVALLGNGVVLYPYIMAGQFFEAAGDRERAASIRGEGSRRALEWLALPESNPRMAARAAALAGLAGNGDAMERLLAAATQAGLSNEAMPELAFTLAHLGQLDRAMEMLLKLEEAGLHLGSRLHQIDAYGAAALREHAGFEAFQEKVQAREQDLRARF